MSETTEKIQTKLDAEIQWLRDFLACLRKDYQQQMVCFEYHFDLLKQDLKELQRLKYQLCKLGERESKDSQKIASKLAVKRKHYLRNMRELKLRKSNCQTDYKAHTKNKRQRLAALEDAKTRLQEMTKPVLETLTFEKVPKNRTDAIHYVTERFYPFINRLSRSVYMNAYKRHSKKIDYLAAYEVDGRTRLHIHAILNCPKHISESRFKRKIREYWDAGWVNAKNTKKYFTDDPSDYGNYMLKEETKDLRTTDFSEYLIP